MPKNENMPRWRGDEAEVALRAVRCRSCRDQLVPQPGMRSRMPCSLALPTARAAWRRARIRRTISAPWSGGIDHMPRARRTSWLRVASAAVGVSLMTCSAPVRSRYSPKFFEHDTAHSTSGSSAQNSRMREGVRLHPLAQALIGHVDEGQQRAALHQLEQRAPLVLRTGRRRSGCGRRRAAAPPRAAAGARAPPSSRRTAPRRWRSRSTDSARASGRCRRAAARGSPRWEYSRAPPHRGGGADQLGPQAQRAAAARGLHGASRARP